MFLLKGIHLIFSAALLLQLTYRVEADDDDAISVSLAGEISGAADALKEKAENIESSFSSSSSSSFDSSSSTNGGGFDEYNVFNDITPYVQNDLPSQYNSYSDLVGGFANDGLQYGVNGVKAKIDFDKNLLDSAQRGAYNAGNWAKAGFGKSVDVGNAVFGYGVEGLKKKMEFEKAMLDQGMKSAQSAGGVFKNGLSKSFGAASRFGGGLSSFGGNLFKQGSNAFGGMYGQGSAAAQATQDAAGSYGSGLGLGGDSASGGGGGFSIGF